MDRAAVIREHQEYVERVFADQGEFRTMGVVYATCDPNGRPIDGPFAVPVVGCRDTQALASVMKRLAEVTHAVACLVMSEVWMAPADVSRPLDDQLRPSERDDRVESLMVVAEIGGVREGWFSAITRDAAGNGTAGPWRKMDGTLAGRLTGLLPNLN